MVCNRLTREITVPIRARAGRSPAAMTLERSPAPGRLQGARGTDPISEARRRVGVRSFLETMGRGAL